MSLKIIWYFLILNISVSMVTTMSLKISSSDEENVVMANLINKRSVESLGMSRVSYPQCLRLMAISKEVIQCSIRPHKHVRATVRSHRTGIQLKNWLKSQKSKSTLNRSYGPLLTFPTSSFLAYIQ